MQTNLNAERPPVPNSAASPNRRASLRRPAVLGSIVLVLLFLLGSVGLPASFGSSPRVAQAPQPTANLATHALASAAGSAALPLLAPGSSSGPVTFHLGSSSPYAKLANGWSNSLGLARGSLGTHPSLSPLITSDATNYVVAGGQSLAYSGGPFVTQAGGSNKTLVSGESSYTYNGSGSSYPGYISGWLWTHGFSQASRSSNGGQSWTNSWIPANTSWTTAGGALTGDLALGASSVVSTGGATPSLYYLETVEQDCVALGFANAIAANPAMYNSLWPAYCNSTQRAAAPGGFAIAKSTNGGLSWNRPSFAVQGQMFWMNVTNTVWSACGFGSYVGLANGSYAPVLSFNAANGLLILTYMEFSINIVQLACVSGQLQGFEFVNLTGMITVSANGGTTWSTPHAIGPAFGAFPYLNYFAGQQPVAAVGPAPHYTDYAVVQDVANATVATTGTNSKPVVTVPVAFSTSTNNGTSWSTPADISTVTENYVNSSNPAQLGNQYFFNQSAAKIAADNWSGSAYKGNLYLVWEDNRTSTLPGTPSIGFSRSTDGGSTWSTPVFLSAPDTSSHFYYYPTISVAPNGEIWVTYLGESQYQSGGLYPYRIYGVTSADGGATWSGQFAISDQDSTQSVGSAGGEPSVVGTSAGAYVLWADCRGISCPGTNGAYQRAVMAANVHAVPILLVGPATAPALVSTLGAAPASGTIPATFGFETNAQVTVSVQSTLPDNATYVWSFAGFSGIGASTSTSTTFSYAGSGSLTATYVPVKAGWITGTIGPISPSLVVSVNSVAVTGFTPFNSTAEAFNVTEAGAASYTLAATENAYATQSYLVGVSSGLATHKDIWLPRLTGYLNGTVTPHSAVLTVNGSSVSVNVATGIFSDNLAWGTYNIVASASGFPNYTATIAVAYGTTTPLIISLAYGWINGSITPTTGHVSINNQSITVLPTGNFNQNLSGGTYYVVGTLPGYSWFHTLVRLAPGHAVRLTIALTNRGWIIGTAGPSAALAAGLSLYVDGNSVNINGGHFNYSALSGSHTVTAGASGYQAYSKHLPVTAGNSTDGSFNLTAVVQNCTQTNTCPNKNTNNGGGLSGNGLLLWVGLGAVAAIVAGLLAVLLLRRRKGGGGGSPSRAPSEPMEPQPYPEEPAGGAMGGGSSPPPPSG